MSGLKGYSTMSREQVQQLLRGEKVIKYRKNQKHQEIQTEFPLCQNCVLTKLIEQMCKQRNIIIDNIEIDADTGEVLHPCVERAYRSLVFVTLSSHKYGGGFS